MVYTLDFWDIVKTQPHEKTTYPWAKAYRWDGTKYVVSKNQKAIWKTIFRDCEIRKVTQTEIVLVYNMAELIIPFRVAQRIAYQIYGK